MAEEEDFSFPATTDTPPRFIESPPLWRTDNITVSSPPNTPERNHHQDHGDHDYYCNFFASRTASSMSQRKSFSYVERGTKMERGGLSDDDDDDEEEKMDMLWEDFNEEFSARNSKATTMADSGNLSPGRMLNFGCVQALKLSKANKKPSIVVFMKIFKKMFLHQSSNRPIKKNHQW